MLHPEPRILEIIHFNGRLVDRGEARVSVFDYGFLYGFGLFETMRAYQGVVFRLDEHIARLLRGADRLGFEGCLSAAGLVNACNETLRANGLSEARVRLTVTPGDGDGMPDPRTCRQPTVLVTARKYVPYSVDKLAQGFSAVTATRRRCRSSSLAGTKSLSYMECLLARFEAQRRGAEEALILKENGDLAEGSISNVFVVKTGILITPGPEGILPGVARAEVINAAVAAGMVVEERPFGIGELLEADEAFLTNSVIEVMPLTSVEGRAIGGGRPGPVTSRLASEYRDTVDRAIAGSESAS